MKKLIVAGIILLAIGIVVGLVSFALMGFRFGNFETVEYHQVTQELRGDFQHISIQGGTEYVTLQRTAEKAAKLVTMESDNVRHVVSVENGTLYIRQVDERKWHERFGITMQSPELVLQLPEGVYGDLTVENSTGDIHVPGSLAFDSIRIRCSTGDVAVEASAEREIAIETSTGHISLTGVSTGALDLRVSTGRVQLENVRCDSLYTQGSTGVVTLVDVVAVQSITVERSTGDVSLAACDAPAVTVHTGTGDVKGSLLTGKTFRAETDTGKVRVPQDSPGGTCEITTNTGDIVIELTNG